MENEYGDNDIPTYDEILSIARHMFVLALDDMAAGLAQLTVEQLRANIREHLIAAGCDPQDEKQLRAFMIGSLITIHSQIAYSQIGHVTAMVPAASVDMIKNPVEENEIISLESIRKILDIDKVEAKKESLFLCLIRKLFSSNHIER